MSLRQSWRINIAHSALIAARSRGRDYTTQPRAKIRVGSTGCLTPGGMGWHRSAGIAVGRAWPRPAGTRPTDYARAQRRANLRPPPHSRRKSKSKKQDLSAAIRRPAASLMRSSASSPCSAQDRARILCGRSAWSLTRSNRPTASPALSGTAQAYSLASVPEEPGEYIAGQSGHGATNSSAPRALSLTHWQQYSPRWLERPPRRRTSVP